MKRFEIMLIGTALLLLALPGASAQDDDNIPKLIAQGEGMVSVPADKVTIVLGVETRDKSAADAAAANAVLMNNTVQALVAAGVDRDNIQTSQFTITTLDDRDMIPFMAAEVAEDEEGADVDNVTPVFVVTNRVIINMTDLDMVGDVLDAAIGAGTNTVQGVTFGLLDESNATDMALIEAVDDAQRRAQVMADAADVNLERVIEVSGGYSYFQPRAEAISFRLAGGAAPTTPVLAGDVDVSASVTLTYEIS